MKRNRVYVVEVLVDGEWKIFLQPNLGFFQRKRPAEVAADYWGILCKAKLRAHPYYAEGE